LNFCATFREDGPSNSKPTWLHFGFKRFGCSYVYARLSRSLPLVSREMAARRFNIASHLDMPGMFHVEHCADRSLCGDDFFHEAPLRIADRPDNRVLILDRLSFGYTELAAVLGSRGEEVCTLTSSRFVSPSALTKTVARNVWAERLQLPENH
jgi:hypothetical protein